MNNKHTCCGRSIKNNQDRNYHAMVHHADAGSPEARLKSLLVAAKRAETALRELLGEDRTKWDWKFSAFVALRNEIVRNEAVRP